MATTLMPHLSFRDRARQALEFYHSVLGGELQISTYAEFVDAGMPVDEADRDLIAHGQLTTAHGVAIAAADMPPGMDYVAPNSGVTVAYVGGPDDRERLVAAFEALSAGGEVEMQMDEAPWGDWFASFTDRFGISWMIDIGAA